jgi:hypothetical protein
MLKSTPKCHKLTLEVLKVNIFRFKMQNDPIWAYKSNGKKSSAPQKKAQNCPLGNYRVCPNSGNLKAWHVCFSCATRCVYLTVVSLFFQNKPDMQVALTGEEEEEEEAAGVDPELLIKHPLQNKWALWFYKHDKNKDWVANLKLITAFDTVEDFWA